MTTELDVPSNVGNRKKAVIFGVSIVLLLGVAILARNQFGGSSQTIPNDKWRRDWYAFAAEVAVVAIYGNFTPVKADARPGALIAIDAKAGKDSLQGQLFEKFSGPVEWHGKVQEYSRGELGVTVTNSDLPIPGGFILPGTLWIRLKSKPNRELKPMDDVVIRATLQRPTDANPFSGILVIGEMMLVRLVDGVVE